jgi:acyl-CoA reductase-like NAD-dependent aldehyde dehydrogenase
MVGRGERSHNLTVLDPATEEVVREVPYGAAADCRAAIDAAQRAFSSWAGRRG